MSIKTTLPKIDPLHIIKYDHLICIYIYTVETLLWGHTFAPEMWPFKRGDLSSGVAIYIVLWSYQRGWSIVKMAS